MKLKPLVIYNIKSEKYGNYQVMLTKRNYLLAKRKGLKIEKPKKKGQ